MSHVHQVVFSELEEAGTADALHLKEDFPFEGGPPTTARASHSPGLGRLIEAIEDCREALSTAEHNSLVKVLLRRSRRPMIPCPACTAPVIPLGDRLIHSTRKATGAGTTCLTSVS